MSVEAFRVENFMCFEDSEWVELRPLTLLYGRHSSGKSAFLRALLLLQQAHNRTQAPDSPPASLIFGVDDGLDFGGYRELVHKYNSRLSISFWFKCNLKPDDDAAPNQDIMSALSELGIERTSVKIGLSYSLWGNGGVVGLQGVELLDWRDKLIWRATAPNSGHAEEPWCFEANSGFSNVWLSTTLTVDQGFFPQLRVLREQERELGSQFQAIQQLLQHLERSISSFAGSIEYFGPIRAEPQRFLPIKNNGQVISAVNDDPLVTLLQKPSKEIIMEINGWLSEAAINEVRLGLRRHKGNPPSYELLFSDPWTTTMPRFATNVRQSSRGIYHVIQLIAKILQTPANATLLLSHPELHLAPGTQSELGDLLIRAAAHKKVRLLVETHSENLFVRIRRRLAESQTGYVRPQEYSYLPHEAVGVYFINKERAKSEINMIWIGPKGELEYKPVGYKGFFSSDGHDTVKLTKARLGR